jgi:hypothetical protein
LRIQEPQSDGFSWVYHCALNQMQKNVAHGIAQKRKHHHDAANDVKIP